MKVINLTEKSKMYTSNVYLILGSMNRIEDKNTLVDVGRDNSIFWKINHISTGLGKKKIDQVVLTHDHFDHAELLPSVIKKYNPVVFAFSSFRRDVSIIVKDGDKIMLGDVLFEVINIQVHSHDSICLFSEDTGIIFAGDTGFPIDTSTNIIDKSNTSPIMKLYEKNIQTIYYGHGDPEDYSNKKFNLFK